MRNIKACLARLSHHPGVYQMLGRQGEVLYVGKAKNLKKRISTYFVNRAKDPKTRSLIKQIKDINITITQSENEAILLECNLIKKYRPRYNILLRDDKSYPYIVITQDHLYPRIDLYRGTRKKNGLYFGPYANSFAVRETIHLLQKLFRIRTCRDHYFESRTRPCLLYQMERCTGPCVQLISKEEYAKNVQLVILFLEGKSQEVVNLLQNKMEHASQALDFELAAQYRDQITRLRQIQERQCVNIEEGDADIIGFAVSSGMVCIQLLSIRKGQLLGSRSYFPIIPLHSTTGEILHAFLTQHYFGHVTHLENLPKQIIVSTLFPESDSLEQVLTNNTTHQVKIIHPLRGEKKKWLAMATKGAKESLAFHLFNRINIHERVVALQKALALKTRPRRIECFDISHFRGEATIASCVVFDQNGPLKSDYRRFNITNITPGDDLAAMRQVLERRFKHSTAAAPAEYLKKMPDLILIDGGKTQLAVAHDVMKSLGIQVISSTRYEPAWTTKGEESRFSPLETPSRKDLASKPQGIRFIPTLVGVAKGSLRKPGYETLHRVDHLPLHLPADSLALHFIQQIRDEAHRFAITGHRMNRDKSRRQSSLERIPGIGVKRRRELLRYFGGIQGLAHASLDEIIKVPGISLSLAERIFTAFHGATL